MQNIYRCRKAYEKFSEIFLIIFEFSEIICYNEYMFLIVTASAVHYKNCDVAGKPDQLATARLCKQQIEKKNKQSNRKNKHNIR